MKFIKVYAYLLKLTFLQVHSKIFSYTFSKWRKMDRGIFEGLRSLFYFSIRMYKNNLLIKNKCKETIAVLHNKDVQEIAFLGSDAMRRLIELTSECVSEKVRLENNVSLDTYQGVVVSMTPYKTEKFKTVSLF
ncbi:MAG: hypothetical protein HYW47_00830 [Deltaproteobacteria bacterium]|nr:hypothetical protein [Deltaproteobacteria bacterium]